MAWYSNGKDSHTQHEYKTEETKSDYKNPRVGQGSKTDTYKRWKMEGILNDKLLLMEGYARDGGTDFQIAEALSISTNTLRNMRNRYPDVAEALRKGKEVVDYAVENALLRKALGGDTNAIMFWLKNRRPDKWRDLKELNTNLQDGYVNIDLSGIIGSIKNNHLKLEVSKKDVETTEEV